MTSSNSTCRFKLHSTIQLYICFGKKAQPDVFTEELRFFRVYTKYKINSLTLPCETLDFALFWDPEVAHAVAQRPLDEKPG